MIITKLIGGLGNQMFQYAAGRSFALKLHTQLKLDVGSFNNEGVTRRKYGLQVFNIKAQIASDQEIDRLKLSPQGLLNYFPRVVKLIEFATGRRHVIESDYRLDLPPIRDASYFEGNWNSERYFKDIESVIRRDFTFKMKPDTKNRKLLNLIRKSNAVGIHIRRGDYITNPKVNQKYWTCSAEYYNSAIKLVRNKITKPVFFIFSDDPVWIAEHFKNKPNFIVVTHNTGKKSYEDLRLMIACKHNILANSSFSWWGAWLNNNHHKIVIAPKLWFKDTFLESTELVPSTWVRI